MSVYRTIGPTLVQNATWTFVVKEKWCKLNESLMLSVEALPGVLENRGKGHLFQGNRGTKTVLGNREHKKTNFRYLRNRNKPIYFRGTREQVPPWEGLNVVCFQEGIIFLGI